MFVSSNNFRKTKFFLDGRSYFYLKIFDDGEGVPEEELEAIVRRGTRVVGKWEGHGLGLAIVEDLAEANDCTVLITNSQNGGLEINGDGFTKEIPNLLVAGEAAGGIHGTNRLMGNSLLDVIVFGRNAGKKAAAKCKDVELGKLNLDHIYHYEDELEQADIHTGKMSPMLLPNYARHEQR